METITIKIGGKMAGSAALLADFARELKALSTDHRFVVVHGGGAEVTDLTKTLLGRAPEFRNGLRVTTPEEMDIVEMVLSGRVNKRLVRLFQAQGVDAVGLSGADGQCFAGKPVETETRTGTVTKVNTKLLATLLDSGFTPLLSSTTMDAKGDGLNINADQAAFPLAIALGSRALLFFSDIPGVLDKTGAIIPTLTIQRAEEEIAAGTISGGMIPKVGSSLEALRNGVERIIIGQYAGPGSLASLLGGGSGTAIVA